MQQADSHKSRPQLAPQLAGPQLAASRLADDVAAMMLLAWQLSMLARQQPMIF